MDGMAIAIAEDLKFDMARVTQIFFKIDRRIAKGRFGFGPCLLNLGLQLFFAIHDLHAASAAARRRLDDDRIADLARYRFGFIDILNRAIGAGNKRQAQCACGPLRLHLVAHRADMFGLGANPRDIMAFDDFGKLCVFRQKAIAGMDRIGMVDFCGGNNRRNVQIAVSRRGRSDANGLIRQPHMHGVGISG